MATTTTTLGGGPVPSRWGRAARLLTIPGLIITFGLVGGVLAALGKVQLAAIFVGLVLAGLVVVSRKAIFWFVLVAAVVVTGVAQLYFPDAKLVRYVVPAASLAFLLHWVTDQFTHRRRTVDERRRT